MKTLLYAINNIVDLDVVKATKAKRTEVQDAYKILKGDEGKKYNGPKLEVTTTQHQVVVKGKEVTKSISMILPSEHIKMSMANPREAKHLSALPDRSVNVSNGLTTGKKWVEHPDFQHPQVIVAGKDFWVGDLADGYIVMQLKENFGVADQLTEVPQRCLLNVKDKAASPASKYCTLGSTDLSLMPVHHHLLFERNKSKVEKESNPGEYYKVVICPEILFSDDTSGGKSKQHIPYESWSMVHAALPFEDRGRRENTKFIVCVSKSDGLSSINFVRE